MKLGHIATLLLLSASLCAPAIAQTLPKVAIDCGPTITIGYDLEDFCYVVETQRDLLVTITVAPSATSKLTLSRSAYSAGSSKTQVIVVGEFLPYFYMQNLGETSGSAIVTLTAAGRAATELTVQFAPASFSFNVTKISGTVDQGFEAYVYSGPLDSNREISTLQLLRAGVTESLYMANLRGTVAQIANPVPISNYSYDTFFTVTAVGVGTDIFCITQPKGFEESRYGNELRVTVTE